MDYTELSTQERLNLAREAVKATESDHFRLTLRRSVEPTADERLNQLEAQVELNRKIVKALENDLAKETAA